MAVCRLLRSVLCARAAPELHSRLELTTVRDHPPGETPRWTGRFSNLFNFIHLSLMLESLSEILYFYGTGDHYSLIKKITKIIDK